jgi:hypothetical protein
MASLHLDKARRELRTCQPRAADEHHHVTHYQITKLRN